MRDNSWSPPASGDQVKPHYLHADSRGMWFSCKRCNKAYEVGSSELLLGISAKSVDLNSHYQEVILHDNNQNIWNELRWQFQCFLTPNMLQAEQSNILTNNNTKKKSIGNCTHTDSSKQLPTYHVALWSASSGWICFDNIEKILMDHHCKLH